MIKKTPYPALYYSTILDATIAQIKAKTPLPDVDVSAVQLWMDKNEIYGIVAGIGTEADLESHDDSDSPLYRLPRRLKGAQPPPVILYCQGELAVCDRPVLAIVGPRNLSSYGQQILEELFRHLKDFDLVTISGMASGADTLCHELSLQYNIPTIAVLGGGFRGFLRGTKRELMARIVASGGLILSEYKHQQLPTKRTFPLRNRIIAGMADVVFLPEAKPGSGSLVTVDAACKINKLVGAPMGSIFAESSEGTNSYIAKKRIMPIDNLLSFVEEHFERVRASEKILQIDLTDDECSIIDLFLHRSEVNISDISSQVGFDSHILMMHISLLEMKGIIEECSPGLYRKKVCNVMRKS